MEARGAGGADGVGRLSGVEVESGVLIGLAGVGPGVVEVGRVGPGVVVTGPGVVVSGSGIVVAVTGIVVGRRVWVTMWRPNRLGQFDILLNRPENRA